ncbi:MAG: type II secretion system protein [Pseudobdellovibrionaceae bacterium]
MRKSGGFSLIEILAATALISVSALGLGMGLQKMAKSRQNVKTVTAGMAIESAIQAAIQDPVQYDSEAIYDMRNGLNNVRTMSFDLTVALADSADVSTVTIPTNSNVYFNSNGSVCSSCLENTTDWAFKAQIEIERQNVPGAPGILTYGLAYRFQYNPNLYIFKNMGVADNAGSGSPSGSGSGSGPSAFTNSDFKWIIPREIYMNPAGQSCALGSQNVVVTGIDTNTGQVNCLKVGDADPATRCAPGQVATGWTYETSPSGAKLPKLKMACKNIAPAGNCPSLAPGYDYAVQSIVPDSFDPNATSPRQGRCIFIADRTQAVAMHSGTSKRSVRFDICPDFYTFVPAPARAATNGCWFSSVTPLQGWRAQACPAGYTGQDWVQDVDPALPLAVTGVVSGSSVTCTLQNDQQTLPPGPTNYSGYQALVRVAGTCVLNPDESVAMPPN